MIKEFILILTLFNPSMPNSIGGVTSFEVNGGLGRCNAIGESWVAKVKKKEFYKKDQSFYMCIPK